MKDKMNDNKLMKALKDYILSWQVLLLISTILFMTDFFLSKPLYTMVLDLGAELGAVLALGMAALFAILPKVAAKLLARKNYGLALIAIVCGLGLLSFIYIGQTEVAKQKANDPLVLILGGATETGLEFNTHIIATSLIGLLYSCGVFLSYLYYLDNTKHKPMIFGLLMSKIGRAFQYQLLPLSGRFQRAFAKPTIKAEGRVNENIRTLEMRERELQDKLFQQENARDYELAALKNAKSRIKVAIEVAYKY